LFTLTEPPFVDLSLLYSPVAFIPLAVSKQGDLRYDWEFTPLMKLREAHRSQQTLTGRGQAYPVHQLVWAALALSDGRNATAIFKWNHPFVSRFFEN
jgi:hypothetical protein